MINRILFYLFLMFFSVQISADEIWQKTYDHGKLDRDSIVLSRKEKDYLPYFSKILIFRKGKCIFRYTEKYLEIEGYHGAIFKEQEDRENQCYYYIFRYSDRPSPDKFLIVKTTSDTTCLFGITPNSSAEIFDDIDYDGFFEIGGFKYYGQPGDEQPSEDPYLIFEIRTGFPKDTLLTKKLREATQEIQKRKK